MNAPTDYFTIDAVNWSTLKLMRDSAMAYMHGLTAQRPDTDALKLGRLGHTLIFEPQKFSAEYAIWTGGDRRGNAWLNFKAEHEGQTIFKPDEIDDIAAMADAVRRYPPAQRYFDGAEFEVPLQWTDRVTGLACKGKVDWLVPAGRFLLDFKSARTVDGRRFGMEASRYAYHLQLAHYRNGVRQALGWEPEKVLIVAAEKKAPYDVGVFQVDPVALDIAEVEVQDLLIKLAAHRAAGEWPGRYSEEQALQLPAWVYGDDDEDDAEGFGLSLGD